MALREIRSKAGGWGYTEVEIRCDAQAALKRIKDNRPGPGQWLAERVIDFKDQINAMGIKVTFRWVRAHTGIDGNERADKAANARQTPG